MNSNAAQIGDKVIKIVDYFLLALITAPPHTGTLNGSLSRPHSESSGEFSLSLDQEVWSSSGSSPVQQPTASRSSHQSPLQLRRSLDPSTIAGSPGQAQTRSSEVLSLQQFLDEGIDPAEVRPLTSLQLICCYFVQLKPEDKIHEVLMEKVKDI